MSHNRDSYIHVISYDSNESLRNQTTYNRYDSYYESPVKPYDLYLSHSAKYIINDFYLKSCETYEPLVHNRSFWSEVESVSQLAFVQMLNLANSERFHSGSGYVQVCKHISG